MTKDADNATPREAEGNDQQGDGGSTNSAADAGSESTEEGSAAMAAAEDAVVGTRSDEPRD